VIGLSLIPTNRRAKGPLLEGLRNMYDINRTMAFNLLRAIDTDQVRWLLHSPMRSTARGKKWATVCLY
jgi:hypothetical protein